jgi:hypothetical protein
MEIMEQSHQIIFYNFPKDLIEFSWKPSGPEALLCLISNIAFFTSSLENGLIKISFSLSDTWGMPFFRESTNLKLFSVGLPKRPS